MPGCIKRYTDPSSLRKHVKNHALRDSGQGRRKSHRDGSATSLKPTKKSRRRFSESSAVSFEPQTPATPTTPCENAKTEYFTFDNVFAEPQQEINKNPQENLENLYNDVMNFNELSNCLLSMDQPETITSETTTIESIKKYLCQSDTDYVSEICQNQIDLNYFC